MNRLLQKYLDFDAFATRWTFVTMTSGAAKKLMDYLSDEEVREFGRWMGEKELKEGILFRYKKMDLNTALRAIRDVGLEGGHFQYDEQIDNGSRTMILRHGRGPKWSLFYEEAFKRLFIEFSEIQVETKRSDHQLLIQIRRDHGESGPMDSSRPLLKDQARGFSATQATTTQTHSLNRHGP